MADFVKGLFGGQKPLQSSAPAAEDDFADFASAPEPSPASIISSVSSPTSGAPGTAPTGRATNPFSGLPDMSGRPYTKWYRIWERTTLADFYQELFILPFIVLLIGVHVWGTRKNRRKARAWAVENVPLLEREFASVGFGGRRSPTVDEVQGDGLLKANASSELVVPEQVLKEKAANEFITYATGRQNVAFLDVKLTFTKRYNPLQRLGENIIGLFFDSMPAPEERMEATAYAFDGKEKDIVPGAENRGGSSQYDGFVWAIVHKEMMKRLRDERYDISLAVTKDHPKLPPFVTVFAENAEITEALLTPELIKAVEQAGEALEALIVSDMPIDQPKKLNDTVPKKRVSLSLRLPSAYPPPATENSTPIFNYFLRMPDHLASHAHFRPEVMRRVRATREDEVRKIRKLDEDEKAEERKLKGDKEKKERREQMLKNMSADEQRKYLEKERQREMNRGQKKRTMKG